MNSLYFKHYFNKPSIIILMIGFTLSTSAFLLALHWEENYIHHEFHFRSELATNELQEEIQKNLATLQQLSSLFTIYPDITRQQFTQFTQPILTHFDSIQALEWAPRIAHSKLAEKISQAQQEGLPQFHVTQLNSQQQLVSVEKKDTYFPIYYLEPLTNNESALGFDLSSNSTRKKSLFKSRDLNQLVATDSITLVQATSNDKGILIFSPIYNGLHSTLKQKQDNLRGVILGVYRIGHMFDIAMQEHHSNTDRLNFKLFEKFTDGRPNKLLHTYNPKLTLIESNQAHQSIIHIAGKEWIIESQISEQFLIPHQTSQPVIILSVGLLLTLLVFQQQFYSGNRQQQAKRTIAKQTHQLTINEQRTRSILETTLNPIVTTDIQGNIQVFNPAAEKMFGYTQAEVIGKNANILIPEKLHLEMALFIERHQHINSINHEQMNEDIYVKHKDNHLFPVYLTVAKSSDAVEPFFVGVLNDISLQKQTAKALIKAKRKAEENNQIKSEFINMMSHELRTPLTVIMGYLPLLKQAEKLHKPNMIHNIAMDMEASGTQLLNLINTLLDLSKIEAHKMTIHPKSLNLVDEMAALLNNFQQAADKKHIQLNLNTTTFNVFADPLRLQQILYNLLSNAMKFTNTGEINIHVSDENTFTKFSIQDTGCGISKEHISLIFTKFHQIDSSTTRKISGTGLGLAITQQLIDLHNGRIEAHSTPGKGSEFTFYLPHQGEKNV